MRSVKALRAIFAEIDDFELTVMMTDMYLKYPIIE
jgi:hypothetical protein